MSLGPAQSVVIVGGGASGVLLALNLLQDSARPVRVTVVEPNPERGRGVAYSAALDDHVLNVPAGNMSAFADDPDHFWRWLQAHDLAPGTDRIVFVPRRHFGRYLGDTLVGMADERLTIVQARAVDIGAGVVRLDTGAELEADAVVLATGHEIQPLPALPKDLNASVLILGSGLSAADVWLSLDAGGHRGPITMASRHGLLPLRHRHVEKVNLTDVPLGASAGEFTHWLRRTVREHPGDWRSIIDALRPFSQRIWQSWGPIDRRAFLTHLRPYWNIHRHRLPGVIHDRLAAAVASGRITIRSTLRDEAPDTASYAQIYDCRGLFTDVEQSSSRLLGALLRRGAIRPDPLHIGLDVTPEYQIVTRDGTPSDRLYALGPLTRGTFFEIEAVPDIRVQAAALARRLSAPDYSAAARRPSSFSTPSISPFM